MEWQPIETAPEPKAGKRPMFVVCGFSVSYEATGERHYTTDPWCVWRTMDGGFARWPHPFAPTHWMPLPPAPSSTQQGEGK
jgi:hypothetical protein